MLIKFTKKMNEKANMVKENAEKYKSCPAMDEPEKIYKIVMNYENELDIVEKEKERFYAIGLDVKNKIKYVDVVSTGALDKSIVLPRETFRMAILSGVIRIVLAHNHPSGNIEPSEADLAITKRLVEAGKIIGIEVLDHIIVSEKGFFSFKNEDLL